MFTTRFSKMSHLGSRTLFHGLRSYGNTHYNSLGDNAFTDPKLKASVSPAVYDEFHQSIKQERAMSKKSADALAFSLRGWAMERGAVNFAHWASPVRGPISLLKHDAFIDYDYSTMEPQVKFSGSRLFFNETDGSSFPNGGLRETHCAAAYLSWDKLSHPFIRGDTLYLPSAFISWHGDALDEKIPLLRSQAAVSKAATRILHHLGETEATGVVCNNGWEQEFYLVDRDHYLARPDLMACGRTLIGADPPRGQQTDLNYFSRVPQRVKSCIEQVQKELHSAGVNLMVYHSEVGPSQYEFCPLFGLANASADGNVLAMDMLQEYAYQHGLVALFHEKPFAGVNGSGKHCNWGMNVEDTGRNLFVPGKTEEEQRSFITFVACLFRAVNLHQDLIRTSVASAGNDHRLGAQEAPPAIISLYMGKGLGDHIDDIIAGNTSLAGYGCEDKIISFGSGNIQPIVASIEDRNRTAPFPFCGNRFEFRAVGSDQHTGFPLAMIQTAISESMNILADEIDNGVPLDDAVRGMLKDNIDIMFNGDGYSKEWQEQIAPGRGLKMLRTTPDALATFASPKNKDLFEKTGVFQRHEVDARAEILYEKYCATILIEAQCLIQMMQTGVEPACLNDLRSYERTPMHSERASLYQSIFSNTAALVAKIAAYPEDSDFNTKARFCIDSILPLMTKVRANADEAEKVVDSHLWPYPTYQEMLYRSVQKPSAEESAKSYQGPVRTPLPERNISTTS